MATPGMPLAVSVVPLLTGWALTRPFDEQLAVFPYAPEGSGDWDANFAAWACLGVAAVVLLLGGRRRRTMVDAPVPEDPRQAQGVTIDREPAIPAGLIGKGTPWQS